MNEKPPPVSLTWSTLVLLTHVFGVALVVAMLVRFVPLYERIFKDFGTKLPASTELAIHLSRWVACYWYLLPIPLAADGALLFGLRDIRPAWRWLLNAWSLLVLLALFIVAALVLAAVHMPYSGLMRNLSQ